MKSPEEYRRTALPGVAFPRPGDRESWTFSVCAGAGVTRRACVQDPGSGGQCLLLSLSDGDRIPMEWTDGERLIYRCTEKNTAEVVAE